MNLPPFFGKLALDRGFEDSGFVAFEIGLDALEIGDGFVKTRELLFDLRNDEALLIRRSERDFQISDIRCGYTFLTDCPCHVVCCFFSYALA